MAEEEICGMFCVLVQERHSDGSDRFGKRHYVRARIAMSGTMIGIITFLGKGLLGSQPL